jgi:hypothetical protein
LEIIVSRILNQITSEPNENFVRLAASELLNLIGTEPLLLGQKLFVLNIYLENLHQFGMYICGFKVTARNYFAKQKSEIIIRD